MITCEKRNIVSAAESAAKSLGYTKLKDKQREVVVHLCSGNDVFAVLPTGYGKSLCYTCLPKAFDTLLSCLDQLSTSFHIFSTGFDGSLFTVL